MTDEKPNLTAQPLLEINVYATQRSNDKTEKRDQYLYQGRTGITSNRNMISKGEGAKEILGKRFEGEKWISRGKLKRNNFDG